MHYFVTFKVLLMLNKQEKFFPFGFLNSIPVFNVSVFPSGDFGKEISSVDKWQALCIIVPMFNLNLDWQFPIFSSSNLFDWFI